MNLCDEPGQQIRLAGKRRLVEECEEVTINAVQKAFGKRALIAAIRQARPVQMPALGGEFDLWLIDGPHHLPSSCKRSPFLDNGLCRLWLICAGCRKRVGKLYFTSFLRIRSLAQTCCAGVVTGLPISPKLALAIVGKSKLPRPVKRLLQEKCKLLMRHLNPRVETRLAEIEGEIRVLRQKMQPKTQQLRNKIPQKLRSRQRRPYPDLSLFGVVKPRDRVNMQPDRSSADRKSPLPGRTTLSPEMPGPRGISEQLSEEDSQFWLDAISEFRKKGLITDDHLCRSPKLKRALEMLNRE